MEVMEIVTPEQVEKRYYVYELYLPETLETFYVGKAKKVPGGYTRIRGHEIESRSGYDRTGKADIIRSIVARGMQIPARVVYETDYEEDALIYEWALAYAMCSSEKLTNGFHYHPGPNGAVYYPIREGIYRVFPKDANGRHRKEQV